MDNNCDGIIKYENKNNFKLCTNNKSIKPSNNNKINCDCKPPSDKKGHGCKKHDKSEGPWCYTVSNDPSCGKKGSLNRRWVYCNTFSKNKTKTDKIKKKINDELERKRILLKKEHDRKLQQLDFQ